MLMKVCQRCGRRLQQGQRCSCGTARHKLYNETRRDPERNQFYHSRSWQKLAAAVKARANGLDEYALAQGVLEVGNTAHHIFPIEERPDLRLALDNLIFVSAKSHAAIHREYEKNSDSKYTMQQKLLKAIGKIS